MPDDYTTIKQKIMQQSAPISGGDLAGMLEDFWHYLEKSALFTNVSVTKTRLPKWVIAVHCRAISTAQKADIVTELERLWTRMLAYRHYEAHTLTIGPDAVVLDGITTPFGENYFVSVLIVVSIVSA